MQVYNIAQIALCTYMAIGMWPATFPNAPNIFGLGTKYTAAGEWYILIHFLSKFMDWCAAPEAPSGHQRALWPAHFCNQTHKCGDGAAKSGPKHPRHRPELAPTALRPRV